jgi:hypothetical protein
MQAPFAGKMTTMLHILLEPPEVYKNANQEQDFFMFPDKSSVHQLDSIQSRIVSSASKQRTYYIGSVVQPQSIRLPGANVPPNARVPLVLHHDPAVIQVTAYYGPSDKIKHVRQHLDGTCPAKDQMAPVWVIRIPYHYHPPPPLPIAVMSSNWTREGESTKMICKLRSAQMFNEPITVHPELLSDATFFDETYHACALINTAMVTRKGSDEAMTFYIDRIWALTKIALFMNEDKMRAIGLLD